MPPNQPERVERTTAAYAALEQTQDFALLRSRLKRFVLPMTIAFMVWYLLYVFCSAFARDFMRTRVVGSINIALIFGLLQFVSTFLISWAYGRFARREIDPLAQGLRAKFKKERRRR